jgi:glucan 1,3-beta-glucosidase
MNVVRIPIGFWAFDNRDTPYVMGAADHLERAVKWARATDPPLKVIIDLHGAPGSQNGFDNSGQRMDATEIQFLRGGADGQTAQETLDVISLIAKKYAAASYEDVLIGIDLVNEPLGWLLNNNDLRAFFREGYFQVRSFGDTTVIIHDAFLAPSSFNGFLSSSDDDAQDVTIGMEVDDRKRVSSLRITQTTTTTRSSMTTSSV